MIVNHDPFIGMLTTDEPTECAFAHWAIVHLLSLLIDLTNASRFAAFSNSHFALAIALRPFFGVLTAILFPLLEVCCLGLMLRILTLFA